MISRIHLISGQLFWVGEVDGQIAAPTNTDERRQHSEKMNDKTTIHNRKLSIRACKDNRRVHE
jgi:hypothetical protein